MRASFSKEQGLTLVELMIASSLFALVAATMAVLIKSGYRYMREADERAELQRTSLFVLSGLSREITESSPDCVRFGASSGPQGLVFASPRGANDAVDYTGNHLQWKKWVCVYWDESNRRLLRQEEYFANPTTFKPDPSPQGLDKSVASFAGSPSQQGRILAREVSDFRVEGDREVRIVLRTEVGEEDRKSSLVTRTTVRLYH